MQKSNKKTSNADKDPNRIEKIAEIISLLEEAQKTKDFIFQEMVVGRRTLR